MISLNALLCNLAVGCLIISLAMAEELHGKLNQVGLLETVINKTTAALAKATGISQIYETGLGTAEVIQSIG